MSFHAPNEIQICVAMNLTEIHIVMYEVLQKCVWYDEDNETGQHVYKYIPWIATLLDRIVTGEPSLLRVHLRKLLQ